MTFNGTQQPTVVVVGGGYGGVTVAKALDNHADVILVEPKDAFVHKVAALRALVAPSWLPRIFLPRIFLPYDRLLTRGTVLRDRAVHVDADQVVLASGRRLSPDIIVLPLGPNGGAGQLPNRDDIVTAELVSKVKGRDMMIDRYAELLNVPAPAQDA